MQDYQLTLTVNQNRMVLPRCLQILSRRNFTLVDLTTEIINDKTILHCTVSGPPHWRDALPGLLQKNVDIIESRIK